MLLRISHSPDPDIRGECIDVVPMIIYRTCLIERHRGYVTPEQTKAAIRVAIENAIRESPLVLLNTDSGRLLDKAGQRRSFES